MNEPMVNFLGLSFHSASIDQVVDLISTSTGSNGRAFHLVNAFTLTEADRLPALHSILEADQLLCDGAPLAFMLSKRNHSLKQIRGADLMRRVLKKSPVHVHHFFLGSTPAVLETLIANVKRDNPQLKIAGFFSPPYQDDFSLSLPVWIAMLKEAQAEVVWVGLGTPKQDFVVHEISKQIPITAIAVGAAFDYLAETLAETPKLIQKLGFEWLYRLIKEPRRLWKRYLIGNLKFIWLCIKNK